MSNEQFEKDCDDVLASFPGLSLFKSGNEAILKGSIEIIDSSGNHWDSYQIEIHPTPEYPFRYPKLFETGDAFPKIADWHVNDLTDKSCCIDVPPQELLDCQKGLPIVQFLKQKVIPYLANQTFRKREGYYLFGEYPHGLNGILEFFRAKLKPKSNVELKQMLSFIVEGKDLPRQAQCPFCQNQKFRKCHKVGFNELMALRDYLSTLKLHI